MLWLYLTILAYLVNAIVFTIDKDLLVSPKSSPLSYAFYVSVLSAVVVLLLPFGVHLIALSNLIIAIASGLFFFISLVYLYKTLKIINIIEVAPAVGAISAFTIFLANAAFLHEQLTIHQLIAFFLLVIGAMTMSYFHLKSRISLHIILSGITLGLSFSTLKYVFTVTDFVNGLFWTRFGLVAGALVLLLFASTRRQVLGSYHIASSGSKFLFVFNKALSGAAYVVLYYAIKIGSVVFVNALQGLQYVFLFLISIFLIKRMPILFEKHRERLWRKIIAMIIIFAGFLLLFI